MSTKYIVDNLSGQTINGQAIDPKYKVFTALLTQSGVSDAADIFSGDLTIGVTYWITGGSNGDFTNVGAPNNDVDTYFIATGTTPNSWGTSGALRYNTGAPVVTVLENTIGNIWFAYDNDGAYRINSSNLFIENKTYIFMGSNSVTAGDGYNGFNTRHDSNELIKIFTTKTNHNAFENNILGNTGLEIRVYN